jgi:hypothetical protein
MSKEGGGWSKKQKDRKTEKHLPSDWRLRASASGREAYPQKGTVPRVVRLYRVKGSAK